METLDSLARGLGSVPWAQLAPIVERMINDALAKMRSPYRTGDRPPLDAGMARRIIWDFADMQDLDGRIRSPSGARDPDRSLASILQLISHCRVYAGNGNELRNASDDPQYDSIVSAVCTEFGAATSHLQAAPCWYFVAHWGKFYNWGQAVWRGADHPNVVHAGTHPGSREFVTVRGPFASYSEAYSALRQWYHDERPQRVA